MERSDIPYIAFEAEMARYERSIKRLIVALILTIALLFASNVAWIWFFNQFDYETDTITQDTQDGDNSMANLAASQVAQTAEIISKLPATTAGA